MPPTQTPPWQRSIIRTGKLSRFSRTLPFPCQFCCDICLDELSMYFCVSLYARVLLGLSIMLMPHSAWKVMRSVSVAAGRWETTDKDGQFTLIMMRHWQMFSAKACWTALDTSAVSCSPHIQCQTCNRVLHSAETCLQGAHPLQASPKEKWLPDLQLAGQKASSKGVAQQPHQIFAAQGCDVLSPPSTHFRLCSTKIEPAQSLHLG